MTMKTMTKTKTGVNYSELFKKIYYHLYSNSNTSRAEKIIADLGSLILVKVACEKIDPTLIEKYLRSDEPANKVLLPIIKEVFPSLIEHDDKFSLDEVSIKYALKEMEPISLIDAPAHILGDAFQALIGPKLRGDKGQFFTPKNLVKAMIEISMPGNNAKIVDPACGTGGFLIETARYLSTKDIKCAPSLVGIDKDKDLAHLAGAILSTFHGSDSGVLNRNSLDLSGLKKLPNNLTPMNADFVLTNPPFGSNIKIDDKNILSQYKLGHKWKQNGDSWVITKELRDSQDPQVLFLELCLELLKDNGKLAIVLPEGIFGNKNYGYIWDYLRTQGNVIALLDCPRTTFQPGTDVKTNVLFFEKTANISDVNVNIAVAYHCGHDRRGRAFRVDGTPFEDDLLPIAKDYFKPANLQKFWQAVNSDNMDSYYLVPRYYDRRFIDSKSYKNQITIGDMVKQGYIKISKGHEPGAEAYGTGSIPFVRTSDISNYEISMDPNKAVSDDIYEKFAPMQKLKIGDILMVADGRYRIGRTAILQEHNYKCVVQSHIKIISTTDKSPLTSMELLYLLNLPEVQAQVRNLIFVQSTIGTIGNRIMQITLPIPDRDAMWQKTIEEFKSLIEGRAKLLNKLQKFEHPSYEI